MASYRVRTIYCIADDCSLTLKLSLDEVEIMCSSEIFRKYGWFIDSSWNKEDGNDSSDTWEWNGISFCASHEDEAMEAMLASDNL